MQEVSTLEVVLHVRSTLTLTRLHPFDFCSGFSFAASAATAPALVYSTYLRDSFTPNAIATDSSGNIYIAGNVLVDPAALQATILSVPPSVLTVVEWCT